jgi:uncharacterized protein DUF3572
MPKRPSKPQQSPDLLAIQALSFLGEDPERLGRFLALSGIGPADIRTAAQEPGFLAGVLDHIAGDGALLVAFAAHAGIEPAEVDKARRTLAGPGGEREIP